MFSYVPNDVPQIFNWVFHDVLKVPKGVLNSKYLIFYSKKKLKITNYKSFLKMSKLIQNSLFLYYEL